MERKIISYTKGITRSPSDMLCQDGDLAECINLEVRNEELVPIEMPVKLDFSLDSGEILVLVHNIKSGPKNYITLTSGVLKAFKVVNGSKSYYSLSVSCGEITSIQSIGNTIVVYTSESPHYILYKESGYKYLGSKIPEVNLSFNLNGAYEVSEIFDLTTPEGTFDDENFQSKVSSQLIAEINKFIDEHINENNKFMFPFFVRYAIRLFDGTNCLHSAPILMLPSTYSNPTCTSVVEILGGVINKTLSTQVGGMVSSLVVSAISGSDISDWSDIISGIDVFVSKQIYNYDQNGTKFGDGNRRYSESESWGSLSEFVGSYNGISSIWNIYSKFKDHTELEVGETQSLFRWLTPVRNLDEIYGDIASTSLFYQFSFIETNTIKMGYSKELSGNLASIETSVTLKDDYMTHDIIIPASTFVYNSRLNLANVKRVLFDGYRVDCMAQLVKGEPTDGYSYLELTFDKFYAYVYIRRSGSGENIVVKSELSTYGGLYAPYFFYPDTDAYRMVITNADGTKARHLELKEHAGLNGSYAFNGFLSLFFISDSVGDISTDKVEYMPNKLFTSEVNNPFHFPLEGIYTVGNGEIIGMSAVTRPISQGQFGEYPLMMFCSDGNYAMKVDDEGFYERISPVQEDIVLRNDQITSLENSIAVITKKGIMITNGGEMNRIDSNMDGAHFDVSLLSGIGDLMEQHNTIIGYSVDSGGFLSYIYGARMSYDYSSNRLLIYNPEKTYAYFYYFDNGTISKITFEGSSIVTSVPDYPDNIVQTSSGALYSLYEKQDINTLDDTISGVAVTRPLKLDNPLAYKALYGLKNLGRFGKDSTVAYRLYGSMDGNDYYPVPSLRRRSYLFYRLVLYAQLKPKESISGTIIDFDYRMSHKIR